MTKSSVALFLEILNGGAITPELIALVLLGLYLAREAKRRHLHALDWLHLPEGMNLILAVFIFDAGVYTRSFTIWFWRFTGSGDFTMAEYVGLVFGGSLIVIGSLCKVRALTEPYHGNGPWLRSGLATALAILVLVYFALTRTPI